MRSLALALTAAPLAVAALAGPAYAIDPVPSSQYLVTGNGFGYQVFDATQNAIKQFFERPYVYMHEHECSETHRHWDDLGYKAGVPAPGWNTTTFPCTSF